MAAAFGIVNVKSIIDVPLLSSNVWAVPLLRRQKLCVSPAHLVTRQPLGLVR